MATKILERVRRLWGGRTAEQHLPPGQPLRASASDPARTGAGVEHRVEALEARIEHLEAALEGVQDALYRQAMLGDRRTEELRRRTEPQEIARELGRDARKRGL